MSLSQSPQSLPLKATSILVIGDPHFRPDNARATEEFTKKIVQLIIDRDPDFVVVLGDVLHTHEKLHSLVMNQAVHFLDELRKLKKTFVLVGNHDMSSNTQFLNDNHWMNALKNKDNLVIVDRVVHYRDYVLCPYVYPGRLREALDTCDGWESARVLFLHQEMKGCKMGAIISEEGDIWDSDNSLIVSGHIHDKQQVRGNIYYPGSALQHGFGESGDKVVSLITDSAMETKPGFSDIEEIVLDLPKKKTIYLSSEDLEQFDFETVESKGDDRTKYRIVVSGNINEFKIFRTGSKYDKLKEKDVKVVFKYKKSEESKEESKEQCHYIEQPFESILEQMISDLGDYYISDVYSKVIGKKCETE
jgi:DNA repair exonuclease SbcCD nuclease subunit